MANSLPAQNLLYAPQSALTVPSIEIDEERLTSSEGWMYVSEVLADAILEKYHSSTEAEKIYWLLSDEIGECTEFRYCDDEGYMEGRQRRWHEPSDSMTIRLQNVWNEGNLLQTLEEYELDGSNIQSRQFDAAHTNLQDQSEASLRTLTEVELEIEFITSLSETLRREVEGIHFRRLVSTLDPFCFD